MHVVRVPNTHWQLTDTNLPLLGVLVAKVHAVQLLDHRAHNESCSALLIVDMKQSKCSRHGETFCSAGICTSYVPMNSRSFLVTLLATLGP